MPDLDVSDILLDPDFCEALTIIRRAITLVKGRQQTTPQTISPAPFGVVTSLSGELIRVADQQNMPTTIVVHTPFRLRGVSVGFEPDLVVWNGDNYVATAVDNYSHFGGGFIAATCTSQNSQDNPPGTA